MHPSEAGQDASRTNIPLPLRVSLSLRAGVVLALANIVCVVIGAWAYTHAKADVKSISVTGSAKRQLRSDLAVWSGTVTVNRPDLVQAYDALKASADKTAAFLRAQGVAEKQVWTSAVTTRRNFARDEKGNATERVTSFDLSQQVGVTSPDVDLVQGIAARATSLIKEGVMLDSAAPTYQYTKLADLKITMLADATKDATLRAQQIAGNSGATLGSIRSARMGVLQINPLYSNSVSDYGNNDTSSLDKEITGVVSAVFELK